jgi:flagellar export protein FliJ
VKGGLELVRRFAQVSERVARRDLAEASGRLRAAEAQAEALAAEAVRQRRIIAERLEDGTPADTVGTGYRYVHAAERRAAEAEAGCEALRAALAKREADWIEARRGLKGVSAVLERRHCKAVQLRERREQQAADDLVNAWGGAEHAR